MLLKHWFEAALQCGAKGAKAVIKMSTSEPGTPRLRAQLLEPSGASSAVQPPSPVPAPHSAPPESTARISASLNRSRGYMAAVFAISAAHKGAGRIGAAADCALLGGADGCGRAALGAAGAAGAEAVAMAAAGASRRPIKRIPTGLPDGCRRCAAAGGKCAAYVASLRPACRKRLATP
ncbi:hypothetical protein T492DRAFT_838798 [Pavlovales sp. CCMP2436]|nr:hypothetical protein T492DRAFT_838798 [Pavlovales sp. CCMP2436]